MPGIRENKRNRVIRCGISRVYIVCMCICCSPGFSLLCVQMPQMPDGGPRGGCSKAELPPHALALYQQQITMAHGESSQEAKQHAGQPSKQHPYPAQGDPHNISSPRVHPRSPSSSDKDGTNISPLSLFPASLTLLLSLNTTPSFR